MNPLVFKIKLLMAITIKLSIINFNTKINNIKKIKFMFQLKIIIMNIMVLLPSLKLMFDAK